MTQEQSTDPNESKQATRSGSTSRRVARFVLQHPVGVAQLVFFSLVAIIILQNLESTSIDVLFWSIPTFPKLVLVLLSMLVGAAAWEIARRLFPR